MKIIIAGCGKIGKSIMDSLLREGHEIAVLDTDASVIDSINDTCDVMGICACATSRDALERAGVQTTELFISATKNDEVNMLSCCLARRLGARHVVCRIAGTEYSTEGMEFIKRELGISMIINPELLTAKSICSIIKFPSAVKSETFTRGRFEMAELFLKPESVFCGTSLCSLRSRLGIPFLVGSVLREKTVYIPDGNFELKGGDKIGLLAAPDDMNMLLKNIGLLQKNAKDIIILGGSRIAEYLALELEHRGCSVKIIEKNHERCLELCARLPDSVNIICGDGTRHAFLSEEGIDDTDAFVSLTGIDEENILSSYYALDRRVPKIITKTNQSGFFDISEQLGLDCIVSPHRITADAVTQYARALQNSAGSKIETLYSLMNGAVEALEFAVSGDFNQINTPIKDLRIRKGVLLAGIIRSGTALIPTGNDVILPGDNVIVISKNSRLCDLSDIML